MPPAPGGAVSAAVARALGAGEVEILQGVLHPVGVEVAEAAGLDLGDPGAPGGDPPGVAVRGAVALDHGVALRIRDHLLPRWANFDRWYLVRAHEAAGDLDAARRPGGL